MPHAKKLTDDELDALRADFERQHADEMKRLHALYGAGLGALGQETAALVVHYFALLWMSREWREPTALEIVQLGVDSAAGARYGALARHTRALRDGLSQSERENIYLPVLAKLWKSEVARGSEAVDSLFDEVVADLVQPQK